jgi:REP element-mobilizing transposase RayT
MSNTFTQIHIHAVFAVQDRVSVLAPQWRERLYDYITAIVQNRGNRMLAIGGTDNHIHMLFGMRPQESLSSLMLAVKRDSSKWVNEKRLVPGCFRWQQEYGAFSYNKSLLPAVIGYIHGQEKHHAKRSFREEYLDMLRKAEIEYDERYLPDDV